MPNWSSEFSPRGKKKKRLPVLLLCEYILQSESLCPNTTTPFLNISSFRVACTFVCVCVRERERKGVGMEREKY